MCYTNCTRTDNTVERGEEMINIDYRDARSLHQQIEDGFRELIVSGIMQRDEQLPSVRELSISLTVNPNTVQKAYKQLELDGFIYSVKGKGNFVAAANDVRTARGTDDLYDTLTQTVRELMFLGERKENIENLVSNIYLEMEEN